MVFNHLVDFFTAQLLRSYKNFCAAASRQVHDAARTTVIRIEFYSVRA